MSKLRELMLMRHAKSDWSDESLADFDRPLGARGKRDAPKMGQWLCDANLLPDYVICSTAKRAKQTWRRVKAVFPETHTYEEHFTDAIYEAPSSQVIEQLKHLPKSAKKVLLIGHNPGLEDVIQHLTQVDSPESLTEGRKLLPTAAIAQFIIGEKWTDVAEAGAAKFIQIVRPKGLITQAVA